MAGRAPWSCVWCVLLAQLGAMLAYLEGSVCRSWGLCRLISRPMCGPMLTHVEPKGQENTVKRWIFWWSAAYLGAMLTHLGAMLAYLEGSWGYVGSSWGQCGPNLGLCWPILGYVGLSWGQCGPSWGYVGSWGQCGPILGPCWPILGLCWPISRAMWAHLGAMLAHLGAMLAHVDPSGATKSEKCEKLGAAKNAVKSGGFWRHAVYCGRGGGPSLLRRGDNYGTARTRPGGPWPDVSAYARQPARKQLCWAILWLCWPRLAELGAMLAQLGAMLAHLETRWWY